MEDLTKKRCKPCGGGVPPLSKSEVAKYCKRVKFWAAIDNKKIERELEFKNFKLALNFVNKVGQLAEKESHHPDIFLHSWNKVMLILSTHAIKGLSENDFILAAKINLLVEREV